METILYICIGIGLAASCGFRIFVPFLVMSASSIYGWIDLSEGFEWVGSWPALICFAIATALEIGAYYIPWLDNLLDTAAAPIAIVAGIVLASSVIQDINPVLKWSLAVIAGGGAAGAVQALTTAARGFSLTTTAGAGNPVISTAEAAGSIILSAISVFLPFLAVALLATLMFLAIAFLIRLRNKSEDLY